MTMKNDFSLHKHVFDEVLCQKISMAIKRSNVFAHINPTFLIRKRFSPNNLNSLDDIPLSKKPKDIKNSGDNMTDICNSKENDCRSPSVPLNNFLPNPDTLFHQSTPKCQKVSIKTERVLNEDLNTTNNTCLSDYSTDFQCVDIGTNLKNSVQATAGNKLKTSDNREKSPKKEGNREKQNKDLSNLATSILPLPTQLFGKHSMLSALESHHNNDFIKFLKEGINENEILPDDLNELICTIIRKKAFSVIPEFLSCIKSISAYQETLSNFLIENSVELDKYKNDILDCLQSMIDYKVESTLNLFIRTCVSLNYWNKIFALLSKDKSNYLLPEAYFNSCMTMFQNIGEPKPPIHSETLTNIIAYITRHYPSKKLIYLTDIWLCCTYHDIYNKELNSIMEHEVPQHIVDKINDKLGHMNEPSFIFGMKLLTKSWNLIVNPRFCEWFSKLISNKRDVRKCLFTIKDSIHALNRSSKQELFDNFYLLGIRVMSHLNKKSLFTFSKSVYENFLKNCFVDIKRALLKVNDKFNLKWTMVECLISSADYDKALFVIKEFEVLKDLEATSKEYNKVKEKLPNLVWHLLNSPQLLPVIVLFEQVVSIFIFNESIDSSYTKNCNEIFDLIVIKAYESNNIEVVKKMISLLDLILSADIDFEISKESLRYLVVAAVRSNIPFNELLDFVDTCFKFQIFEQIQTSEDGLGSFVYVHSNLTWEEIVILITWMCRHVKINLVRSVQSQGSSIRENIMKVCSIKFLLRSSKTPDLFTKAIDNEMSFKEFLQVFTEALNNPKYLTHPIKFSTENEISDNCVKIVCDNRIVYNTVYYSDI